MTQQSAKRFDAQPANEVTHTFGITPKMVALHSSPLSTVKEELTYFPGQQADDLAGHSGKPVFILSTRVQETMHDEDSGVHRHSRLSGTATMHLGPRGAALLAEELLHFARQHGAG